MDMSPYSGAAFLKVGDVKVNGPIRVTIVDVQVGKYGKPDLTFDDGSKLSLNATNNRILCHAYGMESDDWIGSFRSQCPPAKYQNTEPFTRGGGPQIA
jgi:hypothetical protein